MKTYSKIFIALLLFSVFAYMIYLYQPPKENVVYQRNLSLINEEKPKESDEERIIKRAKETIEDATGKVIKDNEFYEIVDFERMVKYSSTSEGVAINFYTKPDFEIQYTVIYDSKSGALIEYSNFESDDIAIKENEELSLEELDVIGKNFFMSLDGYNEESYDMTSQKEDSYYHAIYKIKDSDIVHTVLINPYSGNVTFYFMSTQETSPTIKNSDN